MKNLDRFKTPKSSYNSPFCFRIEKMEPYRDLHMDSLVASRVYRRDILQNSKDLSAFFSVGKQEVSLRLKYSRNKIDEPSC